MLLYHHQTLLFAHSGRIRCRQGFRETKTGTFLVIMNHRWQENTQPLTWNLINWQFFPFPLPPLKVLHWKSSCLSQLQLMIIHWSNACLSCNVCFVIIRSFCCRCFLRSMLINLFMSCVSISWWNASCVEIENKPSQVNKYWNKFALATTNWTQMDRYLCYMHMYVNVFSLSTYNHMYDWSIGRMEWRRKCNARNRWKNIWQ